MSDVIVGLGEIRKAVLFSMPESKGFTIIDVINKVKLNNPNKKDADALVVAVYLDQLSRAGIVEKRRGKWYINKPNFEICPRCGK